MPNAADDAVAQRDPALVAGLENDLGSDLIVEQAFVVGRELDHLRRVRPGIALRPRTQGPLRRERALGKKAPWLSAFVINVESIDRLAAFGVVALLFAMGLELSFERLRLMRRLVFGHGLGQVVLTTLALGAVAWTLGLPPASAATIGAALAMSSTAIVIPVLASGSALRSAGRASRCCSFRISRSRPFS
jgi:hypothetical protein